MFSEPLARSVGWATFIFEGNQENPVDEASYVQRDFGIEGSAENLPRALFAHLSGAPAPSAKLPALFETEVVAAENLEATQCASSGTTICLVSSLPSVQLSEKLEQTLKQNRWELLSSGAQDDKALFWQASYLKQTGFYRWLHVAMYPMGTSTTCVFQVQGVS